MAAIVTKVFKLHTKQHPPRDAEEDALAAMCLWEEALMNRPDYPKLDAIWINQGTCVARSEILEAAKRCNDDYDKLPEDHPLRDQPFDWTFCPHWLAEHYG